MSNRRKVRKQKSAAVSAITAASRCSDCPGRATMKWRGGQWEICMHHVPECPALAGHTSIHSDVARTVAKVATADMTSLRYQPDGPGGWIVSGAPAIPARP